MPAGDPEGGPVVQCKCGSSSVGRATAFQAVGRGFEPRLPLRKMGYGPPGWPSAAGWSNPAGGLRVRRTEHKPL